MLSFNLPLTQLQQSSYRSYLCVVLLFTNILIVVSANDDDMEQNEGEKERKRGGGLCFLSISL